MRITKARIASYGRLADRRFCFAPGMTVFHGPNESGKTTLMDFLRNTLVPTGRHVYPERSRTDSGEVTVDDGGTERTVTLRFRTRGGDVPACVESLEPDLYRSVFALDQRDLDDGRGIDSGEMAQRFLTVPGGEALRRCIDEASAQVDGLLGRNAGSPSRINRLSAEMDSNSEKAAVLREKAESYGRLAEQLEEEKRMLAGIRETSAEAKEDRRVFQAYRSQRSNYVRLSQAEADRAALGTFVPVSQEQVDEFSAVSADRDAKKGICLRTAEELQAQRDRLGTEPQTVQDLAPRMERVIGEKPQYDGRRNRVPEPTTETYTVTRPNVPPIVAGVLLAVLGLVGSLFSPYLLAAAAAGGVLAVYGLVRRKKETRVRTVPPKEDYTGYLESYEREVRELMGRLGRQHKSVDSDVDTMRFMLGALRDCRAAKEAHGNARQAYSAADVSYMRFLMPFSTVEKFRQCRKDTVEAERLDSLMAQLRQTISDAGLDPDEPVCPVAEEPPEDGAESDTVMRIGELRERMKAVLNTDELDSLEDRQTTLSAARDSALRRGAVMYLAKTVAEDVCGRMYEDVQPGVITTADRYLDMMTGGRYRIDPDPRNGGLSVRDPDGTKGLKQMSTGLRAQVMLSVKLAIARELGGGEVPVILDDVLLPFDTERKEGALRALSEVSEEMQVIMFTCDDQTSDLASRIPGVSVVEM